MGIREKVQDKAEELTGAAKEKVGEMSGNPDLQREGEQEKLAGKAGQAAEQIKDMGRRVLGK
ncbi:CsbD family protein [Pilimelia anulata]|nr:CsbD family protein [Pilimelia anulata]